MPFLSGLTTTLRCAVRHLSAGRPGGRKLVPLRVGTAARSSRDPSNPTSPLAYQMLRDEGMAASRQGSGTRLVPHRTTDHMKAFGRVVVKCISAPPKIEIITPAKVDVR